MRFDPVWTLCECAVDGTLPVPTLPLIWAQSWRRRNVMGSLPPLYKRAWDLAVTTPVLELVVVTVYSMYSMYLPASCRQQHLECVVCASGSCHGVLLVTSSCAAVERSGSQVCCVKGRQSPACGQHHVLCLPQLRLWQGLPRPRGWTQTAQHAGVADGTASRAAVLHPAVPVHTACHV
jgi:hypothetical protein